MVDSPDRGRTVAGWRGGLPWRWSLWNNGPRTVVYVLAVECAAIAATVFLVAAASAGSATQLAAGGHSALLVAVLLGAVALIQAEYDRFSLRARRMVFADTHGFEFLTVWTFGAPLLLPAAYYVPVIIVVYFHSWWRIDRVRKPFHRALFNLATVVLAAHAARAVLGTADPAEPIGGRGLVDALVIVVALVVYALVNHALVMAVIRLSNPLAPTAVLWGTREDYLLELVTLCLGAITAVVLAANPVLIFLLPAPLLLVQRMVVLRQLSEAIQRDPKTGLLTVAAWRSQAARLLGGPRAPFALRRKETRQPTGILMCDLDRFKEINDRFGHLAGDEVLCRIADVFRGGVGEGDLVARFGGEEFLVLTCRAADDGQGSGQGSGESGGQSAGRAGRPGESDVELLVAAAAERLRALVAATRFVVDTPDGPLDLGRVTISIGALAMPRGCAGADLDALIGSADAAVYEAKHAGRNQVRMVSQWPVRRMPQARRAG